jgi:hypothetical protein
LGIFEDDPAFLVGVWTGIFLNNPAALKWWNTKKGMLSVELVELVDRALTTEWANSNQRN